MKRGAVIGKWTVLKADPSRPGFWFCKCACEWGTVRSVDVRNLKNKLSTSCGCSRSVDRTGRVYGNWTVVGRDFSKSSSWLCVCACCPKATPTSVTSTALYQGTSRSCGCLYRASYKDFVRAIVFHYRRGARKRGLCFNLPYKIVENMAKAACAYCGEPPRGRLQGYRAAYFTYTGLDRVDNRFGYTLKNTVPCCKTCNFAKRTMTEIEFLSWVERVYNHRVKE